MDNSFEKFFNMSVDMMAIANEDGFFTKVNPAVERILGYSEEEFTSQPFSNFIHPDDLAKTLAEFEALQSGKDLFHFTNRYRHKNGHYVLLSWTTRSDIEQGFYYAVARDITEVRSNENRLKEIEQTLSKETIVAVCDKHGVITDVNDRFCEISGYSAKELIGNTHCLVNSGEHPPEFFVELWQTITSGKTWSGLLVNKRKNGELYYVHSVITPITDLDGNIESYLALRFDVTDYYETKAILDKTLDVLNETGRIAKVGGWEFEIATGDLIWTDETYSIFELEKLPNQRPNIGQGVDMYVPEHVPIIENAIERAINHGEPYSLELKALTAKGNELWVYTNGKPNYVDGNVVSLSGTIQDIHDKKLTELKYDYERQKSFHNGKLASLGELAASIAHEINNPLAIIKGTSFLINKYQNDPEKIADMLLEVDKSCDRISRIVTGLKKFVGMRQDTHMEPMVLSEIIEESLSLTKANVKRNQIKLKYEGSSKTKVVCDEIEIEQVLVNLINNAVDAVKDLDDRWIKIALSKANHEIELSVTDSGAGLDKVLYDRIFEPFFTTKDIGKGTGLGLSIVKDIMDEHKGSVNIDGNCPNTRFVLKFPIYNSSGVKTIQ